MVAIPGRYVYSMASPNFAPRDCEPAEIIAIGSAGTEVAEALKVHEGFLLFGPPEQQADIFCQTLEGYLNRTPLEDIGGIPPVFVLTNQGILARCRGHEIPVGAALISIEYDAGRWYQKNQDGGRNERLNRPDEIVLMQARDSRRFEDLRDAWQRLIGLPAPAGPVQVRWSTSFCRYVPAIPLSASVTLRP